MDASAIREISDLASVAQAHASLEGEVIALPNGYKIIELEQYKNNPSRKTGIFSSSYLQPWLDFVQAQVSEYDALTSTDLSGTHATNIYISAKSMSATAVFNPGTVLHPQWGDHKAKVTLLMSPEFSALIANNLCAFDQKGFADFIMDNKEFITFFDEKEQQMDLPQVLKSIRNIKIGVNTQTTNSVNQFNSERSALEQVEISSKDDVLPSFFYFHLFPYESFEFRNIKCDLSVVSLEKTPLLKYRIIKLDNLIESIAKEFSILIEDSCKELMPESNVNVYIGSFASE